MMPPIAVSDFLYILTLLGVAVFACSGALAAGRRDFDLIGVAALAMVTATGGGTIRDVLLDRHPIFWIADPMNVVVCLVAAAVTWVWVRYFTPPDRALQWADALGLAFFTITGAQIAEEAHHPWIIIILMGAITGCAGGLMRDVLSAQVPLVFRKSELYVTTSVVGLVIYLTLRQFQVTADVAGGIGVASILLLRLASIRWRITLPTMPFAD